MMEPLINIHVVIAQIIASILCIILVFIVFSQTIYYLCIRKLIHTFGLKDELNLSRFTYSDKKSTDDIHPFFRITTSISMLFCFICSISSLIAITHLIITESITNHINYIRFICFISWLFSHYSMSSVFVGRLYVSFKDSIFQYPIKIIRILSISLASLPILLIISFLFYILNNNNVSLIFFISFICFDVTFSIILTWLFIQKLYQLIKGRIMTGSSSMRTNSTIKSIKPTIPKRKTSISNLSSTNGRSIAINSKFTIKSSEGITCNNDIIDLPGLDEENETCIEDMPDVTRMVNKPITATSIDNINTVSPLTKESDKTNEKDITPYLGPVIAIEPITFKMELPSIADEPIPELHLNSLNDNAPEPEIMDSNSKPVQVPIAMQTVPSESLYNNDDDIDEIKANIETINSMLRMDIIDVESHGQLQDQSTPMPSHHGTPRGSNISTINMNMNMNMNINMVIDTLDDNDNIIDLDTPIPNAIDIIEPQKSHTHTQTHTHQRSSSNKLIKPVLDITHGRFSGSGISNDGSDTPNTPNNINGNKTVRFSSLSNDNAMANRNSSVSANDNPKITRDRSDSRAKRYMKRAQSISKSISTYAVSPRHSRAFIKAKPKLDPQQLQLISSITRHGLLLFLSTFTSLTCLIYIVFTFEHYETMDINNKHKNNIIIAHYYLYWNMGISAFLNGLSLYLSFAFAQWFYKKICNRIHKWLEAFCVILIVKKLKRNNPMLGNINSNITRIRANTT